MFLEIKNLNYYYQDGDRRRYILKNINYQFEKGTFYSILGKSGSGKTTFLSIIGALDTQKSGDFFLMAKMLRKLAMKNIKEIVLELFFKIIILLNI